jgi:uncharacterized protein
MPHPVVHFEVSAKNATAQREFYTSVFDWDVTVHEEANYMMLGTREGDTGIDGGLFQNDEGRSYVTVYVQVDDLAAYLDKAASHGATPIMQPTEVPGGGSIALMTDPEGNVVGLYKPGQ